jgi:Flagellar basal body P-ring biosynthesis protein
MKSMRTVLLIAAILWSVFPAWPATQQYTLTTAEIAAALNRAGVEVTPDRVALLADVVASTPEPALRVRSVEKNGGKQIVARLECENSQECLPFFVGVKPTPGEAVVLAAANPRPAITTFTATNSVVMRTGTSVTLQLDGAHVHITIPVICLENGAVGQTIRVTDKNRRLIYRAQVMDSGLVKGRLR